MAEANQEKFHIGHVLIAVFVVLIIVIGLLFIFKPGEGTTTGGGDDDTTVDSKDQELYQQAFITGDSNYCKDIKDKNTKSRCLALFEAKPDEPTTVTADQALYQEAFINNDVTKCDQITDENIKEKCYSIFGDAPVVDEEDPLPNMPVNTNSKPASGDQQLYQQAFINNDQSYCAQIIDASIKNKCDALFK